MQVHALDVERGAGADWAAAGGPPAGGGGWRACLMRPFRRLCRVRALPSTALLRLCFSELAGSSMNDWAMSCLDEELTG